MAGAQASGHDCLMCHDDPVSESVHPVLELSMALQVVLHLPHLVQQLMGHLQRKEKTIGQMSERLQKKAKENRQDRTYDVL